MSFPRLDLPEAALPALLMASYRHFLGKSLLAAGVCDADGARWLYEDAPFCLLAHNADPDPLFVYANMAAQKCFEYSLQEFLRLPSRLSAQSGDRLERARLLASVARNGFARGYRGLRVAKSGRRFWIEDGIVWQLVDSNGAVLGQAAAFAHWRDA